MYVAMEQQTTAEQQDNHLSVFPAQSWKPRLKQTRATIYRSPCTDAEEKKSSRAKNELQQQLSFFAGGTGKDLAYLNNQADV